MLLLCRHGETEANREHIIQGQSESDLTATGRAQAAAPLGMLVTTTLAVHNVPEGFAVAVVLVSRGMSVRRPPPPPA